MAIRKPYTQEMNLYSPQRSAVAGVPSTLPELLSPKNIRSRAGLPLTKADEAIYAEPNKIPQMADYMLDSEGAGPGDLGDTSNNAVAMGMVDPETAAAVEGAMPGVIGGMMGFIGGPIAGQVAQAPFGKGIFGKGPLAEALGVGQAPQASPLGQTSLGFDIGSSPAEQGGYDTATTAETAGALGTTGDFGAPGAAESAAAFGAAAVGAGAGGGADAGTVLCTELYRQGKLDRASYWADSAYGRTVDDETLIGYRLWAEPLANAMSQSVVLTAILEPFVRSWAYEMAYRMGVRTSGEWLGYFLCVLGTPVCRLIGKLMNYKPSSRTKNCHYVIN